MHRPAFYRSLLSVLVAISWSATDATAAADGDARCRAKKLAALASHAKCLYKVAAKAIERGEIPDLGACDQRLASRWQDRPTTRSRAAV